MANEGFKRKLTAILSADVEGYSRLMGDDEEATVRTLKSYRDVLTTLIQQHNGIVLDSPGDNLLAEFVSVVDAVQCAVAVQKEIHARNYGDGVNIAARLESLAEPGGICISKTAFDHIESKLPYGYDFIGEQTVKNIAKPVGAYRVQLDPRVTVSGKPAKSARPKRVPIFAGAIVVLVLAIAVGIWQFYLRRPTIEPASVEKMAYPLPEKPSIAVLPFNNMSGDPEQDYIADGFTENIITGLSQIPELFVIARNSVFTYKGKPVKVKQVSEELGVKYILEGSIQKSGERLRVNAQLIDALKGHHLWAERYDRDLKDLFDLQDEITVKILNNLNMRLTYGPKSAFSEWNRTDSFEAWSLFTKGYSYFNRQTKVDILKAREHFEQALKLDPDYAGASQMLAWTHLSDVLLGFSESPGESIKRVLEIAKNKSEHWKAIELYPNSSRRYLMLAAALNYGARPEEAIVHVKKAMRFEVHYPALFLNNLTISYDQAGRYEEALEVNKQLLERANKGEWSLQNAHRGLAISYARLDRLEEARAHTEELLKIDPDFSVKKFRKSPANSMFKDQKWVDSIAEMMRKAGLPE
jgi:adenylate cyclase